MERLKRLLILRALTWLALARALAAAPSPTCNASAAVAALRPVAAHLDPTGAVDWTAVAASARAKCAGDGSFLELDLSRMDLRGSLPDAWGFALAGLHALDLSGNPDLAGSLPSAWATELLRLESLNLNGDTGVRGTLPEQWSSMSSLRALLMNDTGCTGTLPRSWAAGLSGGLEFLDLSNNRLHGTLPPVPFKTMRNFALKNNSLEGQLPAEWSQMTALYSLDLGWVVRRRPCCAAGPAVPPALLCRRPCCAAGPGQCKPIRVAVSALVSRAGSQRCWVRAPPALRPGRGPPTHAGRCSPLLQVQPPFRQPARAVLGL
jgi:hypothetical protein